jgi:hypothetical protein
MANQSKKKVLIIGDSLCLPRLKPEAVDIFETWPYLLKKNNEFEIILLGVGGATIKKLYELSWYYEGCKPDFVIVQSGIVDCAPRALKFLENDIINSSYFLSAIFKFLVPINLLRKYRKITYTNLTEYIKYIRLFINRFSNSQIIFIEILSPREEYELLVPGISINIRKYNIALQSETLGDRTTFLRTCDLPVVGIMDDHHHLNSIGHSWLNEKLIKSLKGN